MIFFDDLIRQGNFTHNAERLSHPVRKAHGFPSLHQLGLVVPDVEQAAEKLEEKGFG